MDGQLVLSTSMVALLALEGVKYVIRRWILKSPEFEFDPKFYQLMIPFLTAVFGLLFSLVPSLGFPAPPDPISWQGLLQWALAIVGELVLYNTGVEKFKEFARSRSDDF